MNPEEVTLLDIGCNKGMATALVCSKKPPQSVCKEVPLSAGYESASYFQLFAPELNFSDQLIYDQQTQLGNRLYPEGELCRDHPAALPA